ncbi:UNVERIFIED_CONTAM: Farnesylcysteine lyase [Sesamum radiatum]|uniref:Farnesylcysteine lyase n=1 Tax=Sesamum radiatum TaxID=300843 RepID=A0AAW2RDE8_SESRA
MNKHPHTPLVFCTILLVLQSLHAHSHTVCIIGSGIGGASVAHFLRSYSDPKTIGQITIFERHGVVGGRMATVTIAGETFEAGASILHPKNYHALNYTKYLNLQVKQPKSTDDSLSLGIWDGHKFVYKTLNSNSKLPIVQRFVAIANSIVMLLRYGVFSLLRMSSFVEATVDKFLRYYEGFESRPVFESVEGMLKWAGLYNLTTRTLGEELVNVGLSPILIQELVTVITRINYGQSVNISGLAGAVSLAGSGGGLWSVEGGNWQMAAGLINRSDVVLHLHEEIESISYLGDVYELNSTKGKSYNCQVTVVATPLDELNILFNPAISIPPRKLQHTHATFVRGLLNPAYFGLGSLSDIPELVGTTETADVPFSSISILKQHEKDMTYKIFSREPLADALLDDIFSVRVETIKINWAAYPHYRAPETYAPFILDGNHLYYVNAFENAASTMETSAVAAENIARLILSRLSQQVMKYGQIAKEIIVNQAKHTAGSLVEKITKAAKKRE